MRNIYVVYDGNVYTKERVVTELKEENYEHNFLFSNHEFTSEQISKAMNECDEVWMFGNCKFTMDYRVASEQGEDVWQMG